MAISSDIIAQFVKVTNDDKKTKSETTVYGTIVEHSGSTYVRLDGSELLTPINTTSNVSDGERVAVLIKNHTATVMGNMSSPAARMEDIQDSTEVLKKIAEFEILIAYRITTEDLQAVNAIFDRLKAKSANIADADIVNAEIESLQAKYADLEYVMADDVDILNADIENLEATFGTFADISAEDLEAINADIDNLKAYNANFTYVSATVLRSMKAEIDQLDVDKLSAEDADIKYANIDFTNIGKAAMEYFYAQSGLIKDVTVGDTTITGELVGVTVSGDLIEGNTVKADKLVIKGSDGLYYKLNTDGIKTEAEQTDQNSLNGSIIKAKSITASKISVTDLVAFGATIGGFHITDSSLYSGAKSTVGNTTRGIHMDNDGQLAFGDSSNFVKFYKDTDGTYKLIISADTIMFGSDNKTVEEAINDIEVGGRNLLKGSATFDYAYWKRSSILAVEDFTHLGGAVYSVAAAWGDVGYRMLDLIDRDVIDYDSYYTLSFYAKSSSTEYLPNMGFYLSDGTTELYTASDNSLGSATTQWKRYSITFKIKDALAAAYEPIMRIEPTTSASDTNTQKLYIGAIQLEKGTKATDYKLAPEDVQNEIDEAAKTAKNFMTYDTTNGVQVGNRSNGSWSGFRTQITGTAFNVLNSAGEILASYGASLIELGKNSINAIIKLCGGKGQIEYDSAEEYLQVFADKVRLKGTTEASLYSAGESQKSAVTASSERAVVYSQKADSTTGELVTSEVVVEPEQVAVVSDEISEVSRYGSKYESISGDIEINPANATKIKKKVFISANEKTAYNDGAAGWYFGTDGTAHVTHGEKGATIGFHYAGNQDNTSRIDESESGVISINGMRFGVNNVLWSGAFYMQASHTVSLSEAISSQANGVILVFSRYSDGAAKDYNWSTHFVPKAMISNYNGGGQLFLMSSDGSFDTFAAKYLYISNTSIKGHDNNKATGTGACGIKYTNNSYVLRYVIGV